MSQSDADYGSTVALQACSCVHRVNGFSWLSQVCIHLAKAKEVVSTWQVIVYTRLTIRPLVGYKLLDMAVKVLPATWSLMIWNQPVLFLPSSEFCRSVVADRVKMINWYIMSFLTWEHTANRISLFNLPMRSEEKELPPRYQPSFMALCLILEFNAKFEKLMSFLCLGACNVNVFWERKKVTAACCFPVWLSCVPMK